MDKFLSCSWAFSGVSHQTVLLGAAESPSPGGAAAWAALDALHDTLHERADPRFEPGVDAGL